jgi:hypothetical protein
MARETDSLRSLILRILIAAAIAGVLGFCSLAIERMKGFFTRGGGAGIHKIIGDAGPGPPGLSPLPGQDHIDFASPNCEQIRRSFQWRIS